MALFSGVEKPPHEARRLETRFQETEPLPVSPEAPRSGFHLPFASERLLLERLAFLDLDGACEPMREIARCLGCVGRQELKAATLFAFDLLCNINRLVWRGAAEEGRRMTHRVRLVETFSRIGGAAELRAAFEDWFQRILQPFRGGPSGQHPVVSRAKAFIHESYQLKVSLREVATHLGLSRTYLSTLFRRECGFTLTEYLHRVRLQQAQQLMLGGAPSLSAVAARVGYQNYRDFHRNFVRYRSVSPKKFWHEMAEPSRNLPSSRRH
jgi:AraC-like DNA-binding protein